MRHFPLILASLALTALAAIWLLLQSESGLESPDESSQGILLLPALAAAAPEAPVRVRILRARSEMMLERVRDPAGMDTWIAPDFGGFPANRDRLRSLLVRLGALRAIEEKTSNPELYARLRIQDPGESTDSPGVPTDAATTDDMEGPVRILVEAEGRAVLADLIVGSRGPAIGQAGPGRETRHVRVRGELQGWLADLELSLPDDLLDFLQREVLHLHEERIRAVELIAGDGSSVMLERAGWRTGPLEPASIPEGRTLRSATVGNGVSWGVEYLEFDQVAPLLDEPSEPGRPAPEDFRLVATYTSLDGIVIEAWFAPDPDARGSDVKGPDFRGSEADAPPAPDPTEGWYRFEARAVPRLPALPPEALDESIDARKRLHTEEGVARELQQIQRRTERWMFRLPQYKRTRLHTDLASLLAEPATEEAAPASQEGTGAAETPAR